MTQRDYMFSKVDPFLTDRKSKWAISCPTCQHERYVSYCQVWNIKTNKNSGDCYKCAESIRDNKSKFKKGQTPWNKNIEYKCNRNYDKNKRQMEIINTLGGIDYTEEIRDKMSKSKLNKKANLSNAWRGGKTSERKLALSSIQYKELKKEALKRDCYKCQLCSSNKKLELHHVKEWCNYPDLRYDITNVQILCKECHKKTDNYATKAILKREK